MTLEELKARWGTRAALFAAWMEALRTEQYNRGRGILCQDGCHCVLGVLCDVAGIEPEPIPNWHNERIMRYDGSMYALPESLAEFMNITDTGEFPDAITLLVSLVPRRTIVAHSLSAINDYHPDLSWSAIADMVEMHWLKCLPYGGAAR
jgi:hypothetical protein